jgi:ribose 5-phosphate isomerase A
MTIFERALDLVRDGDTIGLGSGRAATAFLEALGRRVAGGLKVRGVPTSRASEETARRVGVPVVGLDAGLPLALTIDGADEVDPDLNLIKGYGRALVREKVVAAASSKLVILVGRDKLVGRLGSRGRLPIEVVPFAVPLVQSRLRPLGLEGDPFEKAGTPFLSDNGNMILDARLGPIADASLLEMALRAIPGVVGTGLFLGMADVVIVGDANNGFAFLEERTRNRR